MTTLEKVEGRSEAEIKANAERINKEVSHLMQIWNDALHDQQKNRNLLKHIARELYKLLS